jgi:hypothetical protein
MALDTFLQQHKNPSGDGKDAAICRLGKGGRYFVPPADYPKLLRLLHEHLYVKKESPLNLVEQPRLGQPKPLLVDLDLKYPINSGLTHRFTRDQVSDFVASLCSGLNAFFDLSEHEPLRFFISLRPQAYQDKKLADKTELSGAVVGCAQELAGIRLKDNREKITIQNSITAIVGRL